MLMWVHAQTTTCDTVIQRISQIKQALRLTDTQTRVRASGGIEGRESSSMVVYLNDYPGNTVAI